jgi:hypothetical protein
MIKTGLTCKVIIRLYQCDAVQNCAYEDANEHGSHPANGQHGTEMGGSFTDVLLRGAPKSSVAAAVMDAVVFRLARNDRLRVGVGRDNLGEMRDGSEGAYNRSGRSPKWVTHGGP